MDAGVALVSALDPARQAAALVDDRPREVYAGAGQDGVMPPVEGARVADWPAAQREMLLDLTGRWVGLLPEPVAEARLAEIAADLDETRFAWNGPTDGGGSIYYRIQGPRLLIEFSTQGNLGDTAGHFHSIYRNPVNEYGGAPLAPEQGAPRIDRRPDDGSRRRGGSGGAGARPLERGRAAVVRCVVARKVLSR